MDDVIAAAWGHARAWALRRAGDAQLAADYADWLVIGLEGLDVSLWPEHTAAWPQFLGD